MPRNHQGDNVERSESYGALQDVVDALFDESEQGVDPQVAAMLAQVGVEADAPTVRRLDVVLAAEAADLPDDLLRIVSLLPPGSYTRRRLCDQLNSAITGHAWGQVYGTVS